MKKRRNVNFAVLKTVLTFFITVSAFFHALPVLADTGVAGSSVSKTITYNNSESSIDDGNCFLRADVDYYYSDDLATDVVQSHFWYLGKRQLLFTSSADYYGYYISVSRTTKTTVDFIAEKNYWVCGTATDILNGQSIGGLIDSSSFTTWVQTDNSVQAVHMAPLFYMEDVYQIGNGGSDTYYKINCKYTVTYRGYKTKSEYETAMAEISTKLDNIDSSINDASSEITDNMQAQTDKITSGYDSSGGSDMNNQFSSSVGSYEDASDSLFESASSGLDSFGFANITNYSAVVTSLNFINTVMASIFTAVGGESGPYGIILSVLFSVVLVSLLIGLYRYYQNRKG